MIIDSYKTVCKIRDLISRSRLWILSNPFFSFSDFSFYRNVYFSRLWIFIMYSLLRQSAKLRNPAAWSMRGDGSRDQSAIALNLWFLGGVRLQEEEKIK